MLNKLLSIIITLFIVINPIAGFAQESSDPLDEPLQDISIVLGAGVVGAILGLSTLSFVDEPDEHYKNISIGGAIGLVVGVGVVVFSQATKSHNDMSANEKRPLSANAIESLARLDFAKDTFTAKNQLTSQVGFNLSF